MLKFAIDIMLKNKGIVEPFAWLRKNKIPHNTCHKILNNKSYRISLKHMDKICEQAWCTPNDLFDWSPSQPILDQENHPMQQLKARAIIDLNTDLKKLTPEQIQRTKEMISAMLNEPKSGSE